MHSVKEPVSVLWLASLKNNSSPDPMSEALLACTPPDLVPQLKVWSVRRKKLARKLQSSELKTVKNFCGLMASQSNFQWVSRK